MNLYVNGDEKRIFLNTTIGCTCRCAYCYLESVGIKGIPRKKPIVQIENELVGKEYFRRGVNGTVLSIGCYSECWDRDNKDDTIELLNDISKYDNYIQLATKKKITKKEIVLIDRIAQYKNQIGIYISAPTISKSRDLERGTDSIDERMSVFEYSHQLKNVYFVLYIKPVLPGITIKDLKVYEKILKDYPVFCVVGPMLNAIKNGDGVSRIIGSSLLYEEHNRELQKITSVLRESSRVFTNSCDIIEEMRKNG